MGSVFGMKHRWGRAAIDGEKVSSVELENENVIVTCDGKQIPLVFGNTTDARAAFDDVLKEIGWHHVASYFGADND